MHIGFYLSVYCNLGSTLYIFLGIKIIDFRFLNIFNKDPEPSIIISHQNNSSSFCFHLTIWPVLKIWFLIKYVLALVRGNLTQWKQNIFVHRLDTIVRFTHISVRFFLVYFHTFGLPMSRVLPALVLNCIHKISWVNSKAFTCTSNSLSLFITFESYNYFR